MILSFALGEVVKTWNDVYKHWSSHNINQIEVLDFDSSKHYPLHWLNKKNQYIKVYLHENPKNVTAKYLVGDRFNQNPEIYAAFALHATLKGYPFFRFNRVSQIDYVVGDAFRQFRGTQYELWHSNAKDVLPYVNSLNELGELTRDKDANWKDYIDKTAQIWNELASDWVVLKYPPSYYISYPTVNS